MNDESIDFEDLFEIVTPSGIDSRVLELDAAWISLFESNPENEYVAREFDLWNLWKSRILNLGFFSKTWASGILNELDEWKARYSVAHGRATNTNQSVDPTVWRDEISNALGTNNIFKSPAVLVGVSVVAGIGLAWILYKLSK